jgi:hypothetical protein
MSNNDIIIIRQVCVIGGIVIGIIVLMYFHNREVEKEIKSFFKSVHATAALILAIILGNNNHNNNNN